MNENMTTDDTAKGSARRRLVRGVFAATAALTLYNGSVAAASITCLAKRLPPVGSPITVPAEGLVRVPLWKLTIGAGMGSNTAKFVRQTDIAPLMPPGGSYLANGKVQVTTGAGSYKLGDIIDAPGDTGFVMTTSPTEYVAVRVGPTGRIEGVLNVGDGAGTTALYGSCWTSIKGVNYWQLG